MAAHRSRLIDSLTFVSVLCFLFAGIALFQQVQSLAAAANWVAHTREVMQVLDRAGLNLRESESAQRGYLLTGQPMFEQAYLAARTEAGEQLDRLIVLTRDNPGQQRVLADMVPTARRRLELLRTIIERRRSGAALDIGLIDAGAAAASEVRAYADQLHREEERLLQQRMQASAAAKQGLQLTALGTAALGLVLLLALRFVATRDRQHLELARASDEATGRRLQAIVDGAPALIFLKDRDGRYELVNRALLALVGRTADQMLGRRAEELLPPEAAALVTAHDREVWRDGHHRAFAEQLVVNGRMRHFRSEKFLLPGPGGEPLALCAISTDITDLLQAQEAVRSANEVLEARVEERTGELAQVNAELEAFAHTVAHDLRAPLRNMQGFAQALREDDADRLSPEGLLYTERISRGVVRMDQLITDLLEYSRLGRASLPLERVDLAHAVRDALAELDSDIVRTGAAVVVPPALPVVQAHRSTLVQVLVNLVGNGLKFVDAGGVPLVRVSADVHEGRVRLVVEDNGIGIAPEHQQRVFHVFERLHGSERYPGTGIGLAIVRRGVERMGGTVTLDSTPGQGSRFALDLRGG